MAKKTKQKPVIHITNDDGVSAPGLLNLVDAVKELGKVVVVAPDKPQSGMGHAITIGQPLRLHKLNSMGDIETWSCTGTPVDCVKLAVDKILHRKPDLCLSGINHGANHSINVIYSGTMSAAVEAAIESIPSVGFSLLDYSIEADFSGAMKYARIIVEKLLKQKRKDKHMVLNVNFPAIPADRRVRPDPAGRVGLALAAPALGRKARNKSRKATIVRRKVGRAGVKLAGRPLSCWPQERRGE